MAAIILARGAFFNDKFSQLTKLSTRLYTKAVKTESKYTKTVLLPQTKFPLRLNGIKRVEMDNYLIEVL